MSAHNHKKILIIAGEASGDLHGARLVETIKKNHPEIDFFGMGGKHMGQAGVELLVDADQLNVMGLVEIISRLPDFWRSYQTLRRWLKQNSPDLVILIDMPEFNLRFSKTAKKYGRQVLYYISPQIWAWRQKRVFKIKKRVDHVAVIFPFEEKFYRDAGVPVTYVGHPLLNKVKPDVSDTEFRRQQQLFNDTLLIALLPGSRHSEIHRLMPTLIETAKLLHQRHLNTKFILPLASSLKPRDVQRYLENLPFTITLIQDNHYNWIHVCNAAIVASGTATLEVALLQTPLVVVYKMSPFTFAIGKRVVKVPYVSLCNIVAEQKVAEELLQDAATPENIASEIEKLLFDTDYRSKQLTRLQYVKEKLSAVAANHTIDQVVLEMVSNNTRNA